MNEIINNVPIIALRGMTILPYMVIHFDVSRKKSINSVDFSMKNGQKIFLVSQKSVEIMDPVREDIYNNGTICEIKQIVKMPGGLVKVLVKGIQKAKVIDFSDDGIMLTGTIATEDVQENVLSDSEKDARISLIKEMMKNYYITTGRNQGDNISRFNEIKSLDKLIFQAVAECTLVHEERQRVLEIEDILMRFDYACDLIGAQIEISNIKKKLSEDVKARIDKNQKEYVMREQLLAIKEELGEADSESEIESFKEKTEALIADENIKEKIQREIKRYEVVSRSSSESSVIRNYIETMLDLPWNYYSKDNNDIFNAEKILNEDHYGLKKVKERIIEFLAVRALTDKGDTPIICLVGPPGTGKTSIASSVARALNKEYIRISLGGVRDEAEIRGHRKTYVGAMPGRIIAGLRQAKVGNPLMLLDEIDKVGTDSRGDTSSALLEILDSAQNNSFRDHYIEMPVDLSEVLFIATANDTSTIPKPLLDRMELIELNSYTETEKFYIAKEHLIEKQIIKNGLTKKQIHFSDEALKLIISGYTREAGVRNLERTIGSICRKSARSIFSKEKKTHRITGKNIEKYLGAIKYTVEDALKNDLVGVVKGLAWTSVGGTTLDVEAGVMPGKGSLILTGKLGDVMKESATVALGYIRSESNKYKIDNQFFEQKDIYIHIPEGAVPKDGPSAGVTMTLAMISALTNRKVRSEVAMTGEITLHGLVLPIGGLKEKLLAAKTIGMKIVLIPEKNKKDLNEIETEIIEGLDIKFVKTMDDVVNAALR